MGEGAESHVRMTEASRRRDQVIVCNQRKFERFYGLVCSEGQIIRICGKLDWWQTRGLQTTQCRETQIDSLAVGAVTQSDRLAIELVQRPDTPAAILIKWPPQPTVTDPAKLTATIAAIVRVAVARRVQGPSPADVTSKVQSSWCLGGPTDSPTRRRASVSYRH